MARSDLEALVDEYYEASGVDPRRLLRLKAQILDLVRDIGLDRDAGIHDHDDEDMALQKLDAYLCDLKEMQIRDGLHIFGLAPEGRLLTDLLVALARVPRGIPVALGGLPGEQSLQRAIAKDAGLGEEFDPLDCAMADPWTGPKPALLLAASPASWRIKGDTVERIELLAAQFVEGEVDCPVEWTHTTAVLQSINDHLRPMVTSCGPSEIEGFLAAISGRFVPPDHRERQREVVLMYYRPGVISSRPIVVPYRHLPHGSLVANQLNCSLPVIRRIMANGRLRSV